MEINQNTRVLKIFSKHTATPHGIKLFLRRNRFPPYTGVNRMCDSVGQDLRSIGVLLNSSLGDSSSSSSIINIPSSPSSSSSISIMSALSLDSSPRSRTTQFTSPETRSRVRSRSRQTLPETIPAQVIDLSETQSQTTFSLDNSSDSNNNNNNNNNNSDNNNNNNSDNNNNNNSDNNNNNNSNNNNNNNSNNNNNNCNNANDGDDYVDDDDDVILVSSNITPVVDLCTPGDQRQISRRRRFTVDHVALNRRRLQMPEVLTCNVNVEGPTTARRRRIQTKNKTSDISQEEADKSPPSSIDNTAAGPTPFMCAVCMESYLQRQPTSTRCGHVFCNECLTQAIRLTHKCPLCNTKISRMHIFRIYP